jgi:hypothetical protein
VAAIAAWWTGWNGWLRQIDTALRTAILWMVGGGVALLTALYLRGATINLEDRHLRLLATLLLLAAANIAADTTKRWRRTTQVILVLSVCYACGAAVLRGSALAHLNNRGRAGFCQQQLTPSAVEELARLDASVPDRSALICVPSPEIALELTHQRRFATDDIVQSLAAVRQHRWLGRVPLLVVTVSDAMESDGRGAAIRSAFSDYDPAEWHGTQIGGWWFWTTIAGGAPLKPG